MTAPVPQRVMDQSADAENRLQLRMAINVHLTLNPNGVAAPALNALRDTLEVISICFPAIESADAIPPLDGNGMDFRVEAKEPGKIEERRPVYKQWLLSKGFHELAKGVRRSLEEAYLYLEVPKVGSLTKWGALQERIDKIKKEANAADFPRLLASINAALTERLHFEPEFHSLNKTRNCLEHRYGIVGERDIDKDAGTLKLSLPCLKLFSIDDGIETEVVIGRMFEKDTQILVKRVTTQVVYKPGDEISFTVDEFKAIAFACWFFAQDLVSKLPQLPAADTRLASRRAPPRETPQS